MKTFHELLDEHGARAVARATGFTRQHVYMVRSGQTRGSLAFWAAVRLAFPEFSLDAEDLARRKSA